MLTRGRPTASIELIHDVYPIFLLRLAIETDETVAQSAADALYDVQGGSEVLKQSDVPSAS